jgi:tetratricopeptide (TPR) repeat protein
MRLRRCSAWYLAALLALPAIARAEGDPGAARAQLQQGYALKQQGKCDAAIPYFVESVRLDRQPKGLLNLADCERKTGRWVAAQSHLVEARDLAGARGLRDFETFAVKQLAELDKSMPKLVIQLAKDAPIDTSVTRDDVVLGRLSLGTPLPIDPGSHAIVVRGGGFERSYSIALAEREVKTIEVSPAGGTRIGSTATRDVPPAQRPSVPPPVSSAKGGRSGEVAEEASGSSFFTGQRVAGLIVGGLGLGAMGASYGLIRSAQSSWDEAAQNCSNGLCDDPADVAASEAARKRGYIATGVFVAGAVGAVAGAVLFFTARQPERVGWQIAPIVGTSSGGMSVHGRF